MPLGPTLRLVALATGLLAGPGLARAAAECPTTDAEFGADYLFGLGHNDEFEGAVGGERVRVYLEFDYFAHRKKAVRGAVRRGAGRGEVPHQLEGDLGDDCAVTVVEKYEGSVGRWRLRFQPPSLLVGDYQTGEGERSPIRLTLVAAPACDGQEAWRTFRSSSWPITFHYPASWIVVTGDEGLALLCPRLASRASGESVWLDTIDLSTGRGAPGRGMKSGLWSANQFSTDGLVWRAGCDPGDPMGGSCRAATKSTLHGMTLIQVEGWWRDFRNGSLLLLHDGWVAIESEDGSSEGVTARLLQSVRPVALGR